MHSVDAKECRLAKCCSGSTDTSPESLRAPSASLLSSRHEQVRQLIAMIRLRKVPMELWECYKVVDRAFPDLCLLARIDAMVQRLSEIIPARPLEPIVRAKSERALAKTAISLLK